MVLRFPPLLLALATACSHPRAGAEPAVARRNPVEAGRVPDEADRVPDVQKTCGAQSFGPLEQARRFGSVPYRTDGALDAQGRYTTFGDRRILSTPGLNCSGMLVAISRCILAEPLSLDRVSVDRNGDSGASSPLGRDWDFGWDLIFNVAAGRPVTVISPSGEEPPPVHADGTTLRGFALYSDDEWSRVLPRLKPGFLYLASLSRAGESPGRLLHNHVAVLLVDEQGAPWIFDSTGGVGARALNLATGGGLDAFRHPFPRDREDSRRILVIGIAFPRGNTDASH